MVGRDELIGKYSVALRRTLAGRPGKSVMPIGLRGVGKTVLLNRFHKMAQDEGLTIGFIEAPESGDFKRLLATRLRSTLLELDEGPVSRVVKRALGTLKSFTYNLPDGGTISLNVDAIAGSADSESLRRTRRTFLSLSGKRPRTGRLACCSPSMRFSTSLPKSLPP